MLTIEKLIFAIIKTAYAFWAVVLLILFLIIIVFADPVPVYVTKSIDGGQMTISCEYMEKSVVRGVYYAFKENGELVLQLKDGSRKVFKEANILWYETTEEK